jgi:hypothetical protein
LAHLQPTFNQPRITANTAAPTANSDAFASARDDSNGLYMTFDAGQATSDTHYSAPGTAEQHVPTHYIDGASAAAGGGGDASHYSSLADAEHHVPSHYN